MIFIEERIGRLIKDLEKLSCPETMPLRRFRMARCGSREPGLESLATASWELVTDQTFWGGQREYYLFEGEADIPDSFAGKCVVFDLTTGTEHEWDATNPQFTVYVDGNLVQGFDSNHHSLVLAEHAEAGRRFHLTLLAYTGEKPVTMPFLPSLQVWDRMTAKYYYDVWVPYQAAILMDKQDTAYIEIIQSLNESLNLLDLRRPGSRAYHDSLARAQQDLTENFYQKKCGHTSPTVDCVGHTHIDVAWLWTLAVTRKKAVRSFSTVLRLMEEYPEYIFMSSQPQLYKYVQQDAPEVFEKIRARVHEGRWEAEGAMFLEADCNLSSGEALVRQILFGTRYFKAEFGVENKILWLPDVFGYSAALPQILRLSGIPYFMTTKISWNEFNKLPYDTFEWAGIDGTRVLTHFSPSRDYSDPAHKDKRRSGHYTTYNAMLSPSQVMGGWQRYQQKHLNKEVLMSFGYGDGGGGPTREMLENQRRLAFGIPGCPRTRMSTARAFFENLDRDVRGGKDLPVWNGELYLEYHRGTYTTMARNKKYNRRAEFAWLNTEFYCALATLLNKTPYPAEEIREGWEVVLRNQFHDILPGSSIKEVYDDSKAEYEAVLAKSQALQERALADIAAAAVSPATDDPAKADTLLVINPNGIAADGPLTFTAPAGFGCEGTGLSLVSEDGTASACQKAADGNWVAVVPEIPSKGWRAFKLDSSGRAAGTACESELCASPERLSNAFFDIRLNEKGQFTSIFDKRAGRELLPPGTRANVLMSYEDKPHNYDAWDINNYYIEKSWEADDVQSISVTENGPVRACLEIRRRYLESDITQMIYIWRGLDRIDIRHEIDWREKQILLKALFPVDLNSSLATFDIQYGNVQRATHRNTSWDVARFEVCMHKWMDISEDNYGLSILNDCKYGCSVQDGVIGLSLLKSAVSPNQDADREHHSFVFTLMPHAGSWRQAGTVRKAYVLNNPLAAVPAAPGNKMSGLPGTFSFVRSSQENVIIEVVKKAEDSEDWIIRFYECYNRRTPVRLTFAWPVKHIFSCGLLENVPEPLETAGDGRSADLTLRPYEIKTIQVRFQ